jgi:hypothetical protein
MRGKGENTCINSAGKEEGKRPLERRAVVVDKIEMHLRIARWWYSVQLRPLVNTSLFFAFTKRQPVSSTEERFDFSKTVATVFSQAQLVYLTQLIKVHISANCTVVVIDTTENDMNNIKTKIFPCGENTRKIS